MLVNKSNYHIGCRICRCIINKGSVNIFECKLPDSKNFTYGDALNAVVTDSVASEEDGLPDRVCSDCAARLCIAYSLMTDAKNSQIVLSSFKEQEKSENEIYEVRIMSQDENGEFQECMDDDDPDYMEIESEEYEIEGIVKEENADEADDAVSFLTGFLKKGEVEKDEITIKKIIKVKGDSAEATEADDGDSEGSRKHACNVCSKRFLKRSNLIDHLRLHANVKIYACKYCEKSFVQSGNYKAHLRVHTGEKPFACMYCDKSYSQSSTLKIHIRSHTQEKNYICEVCDKAFTNASDLGKHKLIHSVVKKFACTICQKSFTQKVHFRKHYDKHHPEIKEEQAA